MTALFDTLPRTLFNPLAAQHAPLYAEVLLTLYAETQRHNQPLSRDLAAGLVAEVLDRFAAEDLVGLPELEEDGGLRILAHLRAKLGEVGALGMDVATFELYDAAAQPLTAVDRAALTELRAHPALADCAALVERLLAAGAKLEREAVPAAMVVRRLR